VSLSFVVDWLELQKLLNEISPQKNSGDELSERSSFQIAC